MDYDPTTGAALKTIDIVVHRFERQFDPVKEMAADQKTLVDTGKKIERDYVVYGPPHLIGKQETRARVDRVLSAVPPEPYSNNVKQQAAWEVAEFVRPRYEAWLKGNEVDEGKTPISTAPFLSPEEVRILVASGLKAVEDLAEAHPMMLAKVRLPNMSIKQNLAKAFMKAKDANLALALIQDQKLELERMKAELAQLKSGEEDLGVDENGDRIVKPRRGRPPKVPREADTEHEAA